MMHKPICLNLAMILLVSLQGCSLDGRATQQDHPPHPPLGSPVDRAGRVLTANALVGLLASEDASARRKEEYNRAAPVQWPAFSTDIEQGLGLYDGLDGACGNQWLADTGAQPNKRYRVLTETLADDRLWVNSESAVCRQFFAVELAAFGSPNTDCGGRTPAYDAVDVFRSLLVGNTTNGVSDGVDRDDQAHSTTQFPFLAKP